MKNVNRKLAKKRTTSLASRRLIFEPCPKEKGLVFKISVDAEYGGFYVNLSRHRLELCFGYIAFRLFFMSESRYDYLSSFVSFNKFCKNCEIWPNGFAKRKVEKV